MRFAPYHKKQMIHSAVSHIKYVSLEAIWEAFCILLSPFSLLIPLPFIFITLFLSAYKSTHTYCIHTSTVTIFGPFISIFHMLLLCVKWQEVMGRDKGMSRMWEKAEAECERTWLARWTGTFWLKIMPDEWCPPLRPWEAGRLAPY